MITAEIHANEVERLAALQRDDILDTDPEQEFDEIALLASFMCQTPVALITFVDEHRQWFKSGIGLHELETSRDIAFCTHAIFKPDVMIVPDATKDPRFADNPLVRQDPMIRFYPGSIDPTGSI